MSASNWTLDREPLRTSLEPWSRRRRTARDKRFVNEFLMDLVTLGPFACGDESNDSGIFTGVAGSDIIVVFVPDLHSRTIAVVDINYAG